MCLCSYRFASVVVCVSAGSTLVSVPPLIATDPAGRCAAALLHGRLLAVLPAIQADVLELLVQQVGVLLVAPLYCL